MNRLFSLLSLSTLFIALAMPLPLLADHDGRGEGSGGAKSDRQKISEEGSGSSAMDHQKKSSMEYKDHDMAKNSDYKNEGSEGMGKVHKAGQGNMAPGSDSASQPRQKAKMREGS